MTVTGSIERIAYPEPRPADHYLLIHLDDLEIYDGETLVVWRNPDEGCSTEDFNKIGRAVSDEIYRVARRCATRTAITMTDEEDDYKPALGGRDLDRSWSIRALDARQISLAAGVYPPGSRVIVAGFARHDCVARAIDALRRRGVHVIAHDTATLPLVGRVVDTVCRTVWPPRPR